MVVVLPIAPMMRIANPGNRLVAFPDEYPPRTSHGPETALPSTWPNPAQ
jgi:hypothetical protein